MGRERVSLLVRIFINEEVWQFATQMSGFLPVEHFIDEEV
jgi:hypothetical protein